MPDTSYNTTLWNDLQSRATQLAADPSNTTLRASILKDQVNLTADQLDISNVQAADYVRSYTAVYAKTQGIDPKTVLDQLTANEQQILNYDPSAQRIYGVDLITANKIASVLGVASGIVLTISLGLFLFALFTIGPEVAASIAVGEGLVATLGAIIGAATTGTSGTLLSLGGMAFLVSQMLGHLSSNIPMITKQIIDNGSIGPGLRITALKQAEELKQTLNGAANINGVGSFTGTDIRNLLASYQTQGATAINSKYQNASLILTAANLQTEIGLIMLDLQTQGLTATKAKILPILEKEIVLPGGKITASSTSSAPAAAAAASPVTATINIQGLPAASFIVPANIISKITSQADLESVISQDLQQFLSELPNRLSFTMAQRDFVITPQGQMIRPNPAFFVQQNTTGSGQPKLVKNKIIVLGVYYIDNQGKRLKLDEYPLDYSIADDIITPQPTPDQAEQTIQLQLQTAPPSSTPNAAAPVAPAPTATGAAPAASGAPATSAQPAGAPTPASTPASSGSQLQTITVPTGTYTVGPGVGQYTEGRGVLQANGTYNIVRIGDAGGQASTTPAVTSQFPRTIHVTASTLFVRSAPSSTAPLSGSQQLHAGDTFSAVAVVTGESVSGENRWWQSSFGNYVWVGGTQEKP